MAKRDEPGFWTQERELPGEGTVETYWMLKLVHPPSASAMLLGAGGLGYIGWRLFRDSNLWVALVAAVIGAFIGAWVGLLLYWLLRLIWALND
jgi:hypothetical protein